MVNESRVGSHTVDDAPDDAIRQALTQRAAARAAKRVIRKEAGTKHKEEVCRVPDDHLNNANVDTLSQGNVFFKQKQYNKAISCYKEAVKVDGRNPIYFTNLAAAYLELEL